MSEPVFEELARELCQVFLGWRLREDYDALLALEEGFLEVDLASGEAWCDGDPIPPLFIAAELRRMLDTALERAEVAPGALLEARLEAAFAARSAARDGDGRGPRLQLACRSRIVTPAGEFCAEARNG
jgi:hypothetical protein